MKYLKRKVNQIENQRKENNQKELKLNTYHLIARIRKKEIMKAKLKGLEWKSQMKCQ